MNPPATADSQLPPPPPPPQLHRPNTTCNRHPDENFTGFCSSCLCERLAVLDQSSSSSTGGRKSFTGNSAAAAAIKAIFKNNNSNTKPSTSSSSSSLFPELRRTKSFSATKATEGFFSGVFEPQRRSCDVRIRNTLWSLFNLDDERKTSAKKEIEVVDDSTTTNVVNEPVFELKEEEEETEDEIRVSENVEAPNVAVEEREIVEERVEEEVEDLKTMKDHIDLDSHVKKRDFKEIAGSFFSAASVFSKKLQKWRRKQKMKKRGSVNGSGSATLPIEKPIGRQYRETQSEIADYGFGRRSCDTDPRFSLDAGRISFDDPRYSFDEPRASWDGYLIGKTNFPRMLPMVSVIEDAPVVPVTRSDNLIPVEDETTPGGTAQTRDYYADSSARGRKSFEGKFERSNSIRKTAAAVVAETDEMKLVLNANANANAKVSPAIIDYFHGSDKLVVGDGRDYRDLRGDSNSNSLRDDCSETFEMGFRDGERKGGPKKSWRWSMSWNIWGFIHRRSGNKDDEDDRYSTRGNRVERSYSESWQGGINRTVFRSNSSVSSRHSFNMVGGGASLGGSMRKTSVEVNGHARKKRDEVVLERNRSARYSPNNIDNGLLRFYLTPMRGSRRGGGPVKAKPHNAHSIARSVLRLY
ncbi:Protein OCTOPUS-like [Dillenia turbinata]|uniref:Protein OCTOPUS-like n=1 Tax=Dillenia turbinata TaxID=194707 RepID=A0AAN8W833_9MAGN